MTLYKRGGVWWYEFVFQGVRIRESTESGNKDIAGRAERKRKRELELGINGLAEKKQPLLFSIAARTWFEGNKAHWSDANARMEQFNLDSLLPAFGKTLLPDISAIDIVKFQASRKKQGVSNRTVNMAVGTLRSILRKHRLWANLQPDVRMLKAKGEVGRALSPDEEHRLLAACRKSRSRSLYPAVLLSLHTGLRNGELRLLRWRQVDLIGRAEFPNGSITVGKSKTEGSSDRIIPLSWTGQNCLKEWRSLFADAQPSHFVFPSEKYAAKNDPVTGFTTAECLAYDTDPTKPILSWKSGWTVARKAAGVSCRWHDMRHTFVSRIAEAAQVSDATIMSLAGHVSRKMMERYSHTRNEAKRQAIAALDKPSTNLPASANS